MDDQSISDMARQTVERIASSSRFYDNMLDLKPVMRDEIERTLLRLIEDHDVALRAAEERGREAERMDATQLIAAMVRQLGGKFTVGEHHIVAVSKRLTLSRYDDWNGITFQLHG